MYEMLLGQSPFRGDDEDEIFDAILEDEPLYPITMPRDAVAILQKVCFLLYNRWCMSLTTPCFSYSPATPTVGWALGKLMQRRSSANPSSRT